MTSEKPAKPLREGSAVKRAAILAAAQELFVADGFDRTSVDAVAARAQVSKRTVYDYFGDKRALLLAVFEATAQTLMASVQGAISKNLVDVDDLEAALTAFSREIATTTLGSSNYLTLTRLVSNDAGHLPELQSHWMVDAPEDAVAERLAEFGRQGLLEVPDPRLAADHFIALSLAPLLSGQFQSRTARAAREEKVLVEGVRAFLRAYAPRDRLG